MSATFVYSPLPQGYIRLLQAKHRCNGAVLYEFQSKLLDESLRFRAISYTWGSPALTQSITCNGQKLLITRSVFELLSSAVISSLCDELPIWIDAICINQRDDTEKAHQVRNMDTLYSLAEEVILWLGPPSSDSDLAMDTICALSEKKGVISRKNLSQFARSGEVLEKCGLAGAGEEVRSALGSLLYREWFRRLWIFQEVVLARKGQIVCGSKVLPWDDFSSATSALARLQVHQFSIIYPDVVAGLRGLEAIQEMEAAAEARKYEGRDLNPAFLLDLARRRAVTEPRDRVYGILGLASPRLRDKITVDYSQRDLSALYRLYVECGKACLEEDTSLSVLYMLSGTEKNPALPSWCPDFGSPPSRNFYMFPGWKAGIPTAPLEEELPSAWFEPEEDDLYAPGCRVDIVDQVVDSTFCWSSLERDAEESSTEDAASNLIWESECLAISGLTPAERDEAPPLSYLLTLCEGYLSSFENDPDIIREAYQRIRSLWRNAGQSIPPEDVKQRIRTATYAFQSRLMHNCLGRKFFTSNAGRIGVGPPETQTGDHVYILYGAGPLYLLRFTDEASRVLGNVYIHELMNLDETPEEAKEENEIVVIN
ncbi:hypothetical protein EPUS_06198 [Endocarpon pusillum Z07020]|uniref:Heterokaryon incompatibility domain-containing protein n=1 Tax=Endocarpon pusillum (strain Z07020 / HMAS-L-300199) TaxID=1263415 RepID=U1GS21_ENDPU|nr:uncharacterized protein EPUS_06198 [Endocarpon pusillum Z07020]ERF75158.1 hypothetical protein EPUS_06198 [Endocarpon pusillum Z07020]